MPALAGLLAATFLSACSDGSGDPLVARGRGVYLANCIACHASDPTQAGGIGPPLAGAAQPLLEAKVLRGEYPPGHTPQRDTAVMPPQPHLSGDIEALAAFLAAAARDL